MFAATAPPGTVKLPLVSHVTTVLEPTVVTVPLVLVGAAPAPDQYLPVAFLFSPVEAEASTPVASWNVFTI